MTNEFKRITVADYNSDEKLECTVIDTLTEYYQLKTVKELVKMIVSEMPVEAMVNTYNNLKSIGW